MDVKNVEEAKKVLENDLANNPHVLSNPMGQGVTRRKILDYIYVCIDFSLSKADCVDWLYGLYKEQENKEKDVFRSVIDSVAGALYDYNEHIKNSK